MTDKVMERVVVSRNMVGIVMMQVCAVPDATDEEILTVCNRDNPAGTKAGWSQVIRKEGPGPFGTANKMPVPCIEYPGRMHFLVVC